MAYKENFTVCMHCNRRTLTREWKKESTGKVCPCKRFYAHYRTSSHSSKASDELKRNKNEHNGENI